MKIPIASALLFMATTSFAQDWVAGVEANDAASFSYVTHYTRQRLSRTTQLVFWQTGSYLTYRIAGREGTTRINSPGLSSGAIYRWERRALSAGIGGGYEYRWTERRPPDGIVTRENQQGPVVQGDAGMRFAAHTTGRVAASWSGANRWQAVSADLRQDIGHGFRIGPQVIRQGNDDITVTSLGAFVEVPLGSNAVQIRAGQARIDNRDGTSETKPFFSAGLVVPF